MRRCVGLTFFSYELIDIRPIFDSGPSVLRCISNSFTFCPSPPSLMKHLSLVRSIVVSPPILRKSTCNLDYVSVVVCFCAVTDL